MGLGSTWLAIIGYVLMIDSPAEGAHPTVRLLAAYFGYVLSWGRHAPATRA